MSEIITGVISGLVRLASVIFLFFLAVISYFWKKIRGEKKMGEIKKVKEARKIGKAGWFLLLIVLIILVAGIYWSVISTPGPPSTGRPWTDGLIVPIVAAIIIGLVLLFVRFTMVEEGTARAVMRLGKFNKIIFQWEKQWMDGDWSIWREGEEGAPDRGKREKKIRGRLIGGLWFYGFWPIDKIHEYTLRWTDLHRIEEREERIEKTQFHEERLGHVLLKPAVYWTKIFTAETKPPERIPVNVEVLLTMRVFNPYRFLFIAPPTPVEDVLARIDALMRERVASLTIDELLFVKGKAEVLWYKGWTVEVEGEKKEIEPLEKEKLIAETLVKWGLKIAEKGIDIKRIDPPARYAEALAKRRELELEAEAKRLQMEIEAEARAAEVMGTVIESVVTAEGRPRKEIEEEFRRDPKIFYEKHKIIIDNVMTKLSIEGRAYQRIETPGAIGALGDFLRLIAAWQRMPMGRPAGKPREAERKKRKTVRAFGVETQIPEEEEEEEETGIS